LNGFFFATVDSRIDAEVQKAKQKAGPGAVVDRAKVEEAKKLSYLVSAIYIALGVVFLALGILVKTFPVPSTVLALVLYVGGTIADVGLALSLGDGKENEVLQVIMRGIWIKVLIVVGLIGAIQAALAYERERAKEASAEMEV
jgi:hypothetical protein